jgi:hypothetical protein
MSELVRTVLDVGGALLIVAGTGLMFGPGVGLVVAGTLVLLVSWRAR